MAIFKLPEGFTYAAPAGVDLTAALNHFVTVNGDGEIVLPGDGAAALGTLFEVADVGGAASVQFGGIAKVVASDAIAAGAEVETGADGRAETFSAGIKLGMALADAAGAGSVIPVRLY